MTEAPTNEQLKAVIQLNDAILEMEKQFSPWSNKGKSPRGEWISDDQMEDFIGDAIYALDLDDPEDVGDREVFWTLCEERGLV